MSESQAIQSILNAELEVYRQKGRVLELEANNAALRLKVQALEEWKRIVTGAGTDQESVIRLAATEYTQTAVQCWRDANAQLQERLDTLETLVNAVHHELVALFPQPKDPTLDDARAICGNENEADAQCLYNAYAALLTHRQTLT